jgi:hypothetical protein
MSVHGRRWTYSRLDASRLRRDPHGETKRGDVYPQIASDMYTEPTVTILLLPALGLLRLRLQHNRVSRVPLQFLLLFYGLLYSTFRSFCTYLYLPSADQGPRNLESCCQELSDLHATAIIEAWRSCIVLRVCAACAGCCEVCFFITFILLISYWTPQWIWTMLYVVCC